MRPVWVGIDVGTSVTKAVALSGSGEMLATAARATSLVHCPGQGVEQDIGEMLGSVEEVLAAVAAAAGPPEAIAVTGQGDGCWLVDEAGRPVRAALSWMDGRAGELVRRWEAEGVVDEVYSVGGGRMFPGAQAPLLAWLDAHEPSTLDAAATAAYCKDVVLQHLTGVRATDVSDASVPFLGPDGRYSDKALAACGLSHRADLLAPVADPAPSGELLRERAGVAAGTPVVAGPYDLPACAEGAGVTEVGDGLLIIGTTLAAQVVVDRVDTAPPAAGLHLATGHSGRWLRAMPAMVGTAGLDWLLGLLGVGYADLDTALAASPPGASGVEMLPYLAPSGERAPFVDPAASGQLTGLTLTSTRMDVVRAAVEALGYAARHCFESAGLTGVLRVCGGGARSAALLGIFADILGRPLEVARGPETGARGAVLAARRDPGLREAWTSPERVIEPRQADAYTEGYARYLAHLDAARPLWRV